ncbi:MAG: DoxX family membrane protein [Planctomycetota bacterium]|nr:DoxX family membrane protein [Planctomycetota bacterium]
MPNSDENRWGMMWATFTVRWVLGLIFFMAGWYKCFTMTPRGHAERFFIGQFRGEEPTWIPEWMLWPIGVTIPVVELLAGALVCLGLFRKASYLTLAAILVIVTYGHLLLEPLFDTTSHIFPRLVLLIFLLVVPMERDVLSGDRLIGRLVRK